jgi:hypothetical protein
MNTKKCSLTHLEEYETSINNYLKQNNINDFTKYDIAIDQNEIRYLKWEYDINKPTFITTSPIEIKYADVNLRYIYINTFQLWYYGANLEQNEQITYKGTPKYYNIDGKEVLENSNSIIDNILAYEAEISSDIWKSEEGYLKPKFSVHNGLIQFKDISITMCHQLKADKIRLSVAYISHSDKKKRKVSSVSYTFSEDSLKNLV